MRFVPTILCVDDDEDDLLFVKEAIQSQQQTFHIKEANGGQEAVNYLRAKPYALAAPCWTVR